MLGPVLYDGVTLRNFAIAERLDLLFLRHRERPLPRWTEVVYSELTRGHELGNSECSALLAEDWLGPPVIPTKEDQIGIMHIWIGLNAGRRPPIAHAGEAESIFFAEKEGGIFATDDNAAYDFALRRLGEGRVIDSVAILRQGVSMGELNAESALKVATTIRSNGRHLLRSHPEELTTVYFD